MLKRFYKRIRLNFRQTHSERVAEQSYVNYHKKVKQVFNRINILNKFIKNKKYNKQNERRKI